MLIPDHAMLVANPTVLCVVDLTLCPNVSKRVQTCPNVLVEHWGGVLTDALVGAGHLQSQEHYCSAPASGESLSPCTLHVRTCPNVSNVSKRSGGTLGQGTDQRVGKERSS